MNEQMNYPATLDIKYNPVSNRLSIFFRLFLIIPAIFILLLLSAKSLNMFIAVSLMILFRQKYPSWWYDWSLELYRYSIRCLAYMFLLSDKYPCVEKNEYTHVELEFAYPDAKKDINRWLPSIKWFLALPHIAVLLLLMVGVIISTIISWFAILITGSYPKPLFDFVVGVFRWSFRVKVYFLFLATDKYPPFSLK